MTSPLFLVATELHSHGYSVLPSGGGDKGKVPRVPWTEYQRRQPTKDELDSWQRDINPGLWGIVTGALSGVVVIDADTPEARKEIEGLLGAAHVSTPRGGGHFYFQHPGRPVKTVAGLLPGLDIRADGGFVNIVGASKYGEYKILTLPAPDTLHPWARLPERIRAALNGSKPPPPATQAEGIPEGQRNAHLTSLGGAMRERGMSPSAIKAALLEVNRTQCQPPLPEGEVLAIARSVARYEPKAKPTYCPGFLEPDGTLGEMVYSPETGARAFVIRFPDGRTERDDTYLGARGLYAPTLDRTVGQALILPSRVEPYSSQGALLAEVRAFIYRYVELPPQYEPVAAFYVLTTWLADTLPAIPYLRPLGDRGTGKSRLLTVVGCICYRAIFASGATTPSPIFRLLDRYPAATLILDEADWSRSEAQAEIVKILNEGYRPGSFVLRSEKRAEGRWEPESFRVYGPKLIASRFRFKDEALESRCLTIPMSPRTRQDVPILLPPEFHHEALALRNKLLAFRLDRFHRMQQTRYGSELMEPGLPDRLNEVLAPMKALAQSEDDREALGLAVRELHQAMTERQGRSPQGRVIAAVIELKRKGATELSMKAIAEQVNATLPEEEAEEIRFTSRRVGGIVRNLGLPTHQVAGTRRTCVVWRSGTMRSLAVQYGLDASLIPPDNPSHASQASPQTGTEGEALAPAQEQSFTSRGDASPPTVSEVKHVKDVKLIPGSEGDASSQDEGEV